MEKPITFTNEGQQLIGMVHYPDDGQRHPGVVLFHGCAGNKSEAHWIFVKLARRLCEEGFAVLRFDFRNSCDSEGSFEHMTISGETSDGLQALVFFGEQEYVNPERIGILGLSLGGCVAACVAGRSPQVKSVVLWNPVGRPKEDFDKLIVDRDIEVEAFPVEREGFLFGRAFWEELPEVHPQREIRLSRGPVLILHSSEDRSISIRRAEEYQEVLEEYGLQCERVMIEGADHTFTSVEHERMAIEETVHWFGRTL